jgi:transcriptional regulator GlxA family with amidase domain
MHTPTLPTDDDAGLSSGRPRRVISLVLPHMHLLDLSGPVQVFYEANGFGARYSLIYCAATPKVRSAQGLTFADLSPLPDPEPDDLVLVPGIDSAQLHRLEHVPVAWLRRVHARGARIASICSGAFALARAGLLDNRVATTHWKVVDLLERSYPAVRVVKNRLFVSDDNVITSAGVASGIDMALSILEQDQGPLVVAKVAREMVVYLRRNGDREQISVYLDYRTHLHPGVHRVQDFLIAHPEQKPSIEELSGVAIMSPRNLTRAFRKATGITLKAFANKVKVQVARDLIHSPDLTLESIASSCGFRDPRQLRRLWKQSFGVNLSDSRHERHA